MGKPRVFIANPVPQDVEDYLNEHCDCVKWDFRFPKTFEGIIQNISDVEGLIQVGMKVDENLMKHAPMLRVVSNMSVGYNNFDLEQMKKRNVVGTNIPGVLDNAVAELILGLIINSARRIPELNRFVKSGNWKKADNSVLFGKDIHGSSLGIIGMGRIGEKVARRARLGFDMEVSYYNRTRKLEVENTFGIQWKPMEEVLKSSDFVLLMTPLTTETTHLIGEKELSMMKKGAFLINASRGQVIDERALIKALQEGLIAGAGLDVFEKEPIDHENPLLKLENAVTTPHIGSATLKTRDEMAWAAARALVYELNGNDSGMRVPELA